MPKMHLYNQRTKEAVSMWPYTPYSAETFGFLASPSARSYNTVFVVRYAHPNFASHQLHKHQKRYTTFCLATVVLRSSGERLFKEGTLLYS